MPHYSSFSIAFLKELMRLPFKFEDMLDEKCRASKDGGYYLANEIPECNDRIADLFLKYMESGRREMFSNVITIDEELMEI